MIYRLLEKQLQNAVREVLPGANADAVLVRPCADSRFGDYQTTALMALAKERRINPRQLAADVAKHLDVSQWCEPVELAGAGFINFRLTPAALDEALRSALAGEHLFFQVARHPKTVVLDFSSPNVAKPMHVGHIRSTILGDCLSRVMRLLGHKVITDNHIGDWGTQFGKLIVGWKQLLDPSALQANPINELERLYKAINSACEADPNLLELARQELFKLQQGDPENLAIWQRMIELSKAEFDAIYRRLGVQFDFTLGESFYNPMLRTVVQDLVAGGIAEKSEGAMVVFFNEIPELKAHPALIQKSDGAANYTTTDLATLKYRTQQWTPDEIVYVTDARQQLHFRQLFAIFKRWHPESAVKLAHVWFGMILGPDGRPFKTKSGENVKLSDLLDEAETRAFDIVSDKSPHLSEQERREIARTVGLGAIKYADLLPNRQSDYVFSWEKMLAFTGNTAPYLQYAYARIRSIFRKAEELTGTDTSLNPSAIHVQMPEEIALAKQLLNFGLVLESLADEYRPNYLCNYLYDLAGTFTSFYENCPVLKAPPEERNSRLALCELTGRVLRKGLEVLGIDTPEKM